MTSRIYLTGFMASGKSTVGPILANVLGWNFIDLDRVIEIKTEKKINQIFSEYGEAEFRRIESKFLVECSKGEKLIIALGGGTIANKKNLEFVKSQGKLIYLKYSAEELYNRLKNKTDRPLVKEFVMNNSPKEEFINKIQGMINVREKYYNRADLTIHADEVPVAVVVEKISKKIVEFIDEQN
ncbi:MAG: shikimate kinase [Ignavibacteria bacterium]|jgi:shikimate kinase